MPFLKIVRRYIGINAASIQSKNNKWCMLPAGGNMATGAELHVGRTSSAGDMPAYHLTAP